MADPNRDWTGQKLPEDAPIHVLGEMGSELDQALAIVREQILDSYLDLREPHAVALREALQDTERHLERACNLLGGPVAW